MAAATKVTPYSVRHLKNLNFPGLPETEKLKIKAVGRPLPRLIKNKSMVYASQLYDKFQWLCRCEQTGDFYCYPCVLYGKDEEDGLIENKQIESHPKCQEHMTACLKLALLKTPAVSLMPNKLEENRRLLEDVLDCIKPCGVHERALEILLESRRLTNLPENLTDDLSECILDVVRDAIKDEVAKAEFVSVLLEDVGDVSIHDQAVIFRYVRDGKVVERFWGLARDTDVMDVLSKVIDDPKKLTAQIYNPKFFNLGYVYRHCLSVHYPPHGPETVLAKAVINVEDVETRVFFARLKQITRYRPEENLATIYENKSRLENDLIEMRNTSKRADDITTAIAILNSLNDQTFLSTLDMYGALLPHIKTFHEESLLGLSSASEKFTTALKIVQTSKRRMFSDSARCNLVLGFSKVRAFESAQLILNPQHWQRVVSSMICEACNLYPSLGISAKQVAAELQVLHRIQTIRAIDGSLELFKFLVDHDLKSIVPNIYTLALLVMTAPVGPDQDGRKQKDVRRVLESYRDAKRTTTSGRLMDAKVMLSVEKEFVMNLSGLNKMAIEAYHVKSSTPYKWSSGQQPELSTSMVSMGSAAPVLVQIPRTLIHMPMPFPVQCKAEAEDPQSDHDEVEIELISTCESNEVQLELEHFPMKSSGQVEKDPLAIGDEEYPGPKQHNLKSVQTPPLKKAKPNF